VEAPEAMIASGKEADLFGKTAMAKGVSSEERVVI
jgi:hypothetical protein